MSVYLCLYYVCMHVCRYGSMDGWMDGCAYVCMFGTSAAVVTGVRRFIVSEVAPDS
jgi:hypothetical protein